MNGWGEYTLMEVKSENFTLQARTHRAENVKGQEVNGTVFSALAAKEWDNASLQVELASTNTSMIIYINEIDFTNDFYNNPEFSVNLETISAVQECISNKTLLIVTFPCGVTVKVAVSLKSLEVELDVDQYIRNKTAGLFGNFNGDITDEFVLPNGTMLPANITEQQIFYQFAKYWEVTIENSIFTYKNYESAVDYQHPEFVPLFLDDVDTVVKINASRICGDNTFCSYDFIALQDPTFALNTKSTSLAQDSRRQDLENSSPTINVNNRNQTWNGFLMITSGQEASLSVLTGDTNGDGVTIETVGNISGVRIEKNTIIVYNNILNLSKLGFRARDSHGAYSSIMYITIATCSGCSGHGVCDPENMKHQQTSDFDFEKMACTCYPAYTGPNCENELDACDIKPCSPGQNCTDLTAAQQGQNNTGFICGPCPPGFRDFHGKCVDVDECESVPVVCEQVCTNTEGSYLCSCRDGYRQGNGSTLCKDIDECVEHTSSCSQLCINKDGNYSCGCLDGYTLQEDQFSCFLEPDLMDLCKECQQLCNVDNTNFEVHCGCNIGYFMDSSDGFSCKDINECAEGNISCTQECANTEGSFICSCRQGYQLASDGISCSPCEIPAYGMNCSGTCDCKGQGSCDPVEGCVCDKNWSGESCDVDVNECDQENVCPIGQLCRNTLGSFDCQCPSGYEKKGDDCLDINECKRFFTNITCDLQVEYCYNTPGSYICRCRPGFSHNNVSVCEDIDECKLRNDGCSQICKNVKGKYNCECFDGYILAANRHDCVLFSDVCTSSKFNCTSICSTTDVAIPNCVCPRGYQKVDFNGTEYCKDIDECADEEMNLCSVLDRCVNVDGNFNCSCPPGYSLDNDGRSCIECTGKTWGPQCSNNCECKAGADHCDTVTGCVCKPGYTGKRCETDIDECSAGFITCRERELCVNTQGSANCRCNNVTENRICVASRACVNRSMNCSFSCARIGDVDSCICPAGQNVASDSVTCVECEDGTYGVNCGMQCSCNRTNTEKCDVITGLCLCKPDWSGEKCHIYSDRNNKACEIKQKIAPCTEPEICEEIKGIAVCRAPSQEQHVMTLIIALCLSIPTFVLIVVAIGVLVWCWAKQKHKVQDSKQMTELRTYDHLGPSIQEPEYSEGETQVMEIYDEIDDLSVGFGNDETSDNYRNIEYSEYTDPDGQEHDQQESDSD
ncbi:fibrillin-1-like isoform X2 [Physella acuta]|uniref:fibrillin-1-like isoform X2 n=1 Tax=Physella acuta TaxID=109671 RepID=UPI0027DB47B6|nr:fibrillin-1-like isoform X2 [Physella acuta]